MNCVATKMTLGIWFGMMMNTSIDAGRTCVCAFFGGVGALRPRADHRRHYALGALRILPLTRDVNTPAAQITDNIPNAIFMPLMNDCTGICGPE